MENKDNLLQGDWTPIRNKVLFSDLSPTTIKVYLGVSAYAFGHKVFAFPRIKTLAERLHLDKSQVSRALKKMSDLGIIRIGIYKSRQGQPHCYTLLPPPDEFNPGYVPLAQGTNKEDEIIFVAPEQQTVAGTQQTVANKQQTQPNLQPSGSLGTSVPAIVNSQEEDNLIRQTKKTTNVNVLSDLKEQGNGEIQSLEDKVWQRVIRHNAKFRSGVVLPDMPSTQYDIAHSWIKSGYTLADIWLAVDFAFVQGKPINSLKYIDKVLLTQKYDKIADASH